MNEVGPACPRCGYDQSGAVAAWERAEPPQCPIDGLCAECGLGFEWGELLNADRRLAERTFESARVRPWRGLIRTVLLAVRPHAFWTRISLAQRVVWARLLAAVLAGVGSVYMACGAIALAYNFWQTFFGPAGRRRATVGEWWAWSSRWFLWRWGPTGGIGDPEWRVAPQVAVALFLAVTMPASFLLLPATLRKVRVRRVHLARIAAYGLVWCPLMLWGPDLVQIGSLLAAPLIRAAGCTVPPWQIAGWVEERRWSGALVAIAVWQALWWRAAAARYLRLPHPTFTTLVLTILALILATGLAAVWLGPGWFLVRWGGLL